MDLRQAVRAMAWADGRRAHLASFGWLVCVLTTLIYASVVAHGHPQDRLWGADFVSFYATSKLIWTGLPGGAYVPALHRLPELALTAASATIDFVYPPPFLLVCAPFAALRFYPALAVFLGISLAALAAAIRFTTRSATALMAGIAAPGVLLGAIPGQSAILVAAIMGGGLTLMGRRPRLSGTILGLLVIKPTLAAAVPIALLLAGRWRVLLHAAVSATALCGLATLLFGMEVWPGFLQASAEARQWLATGSLSFVKQQSIFGLVRLLGLSLTVAAAAQACTAILAVLALACVLRRRPGAPAEAAATVLASLLMTPYLLDYDFALTMLPAMWLACDWANGGFPPWGKLALLIFYLLPLTALVYMAGHFCILGAAGMLLYLLCITRPSSGRR
jgi:hypothetical protein